MNHLPSILILLLTLLLTNGFTQGPPDFASGFANDRAVIVKDQRFGFMDKKGNYIVEPSYDLVEIFVGELAKVKKNGHWGIINSAGDIVAACVYHEIGNIDGEYIYVESFNRFGFIDRNGNEVIPMLFEPEYDDDVYLKDDFLIGKKNGKYGMINLAGDTILEFKYEYLNHLHPEFVYCVEEDGGPKSVVDRSGKIILPPLYEYVHNDEGFQQGRIGARLLTTKKYGFIDESGTVLIDFKYDYAQSFNEGAAIIYKDDLIGAIDMNGEEMFPPKYKHGCVPPKFINGRAVVEHNDTTVLIDPHGNIITKQDYCLIVPIPSSHFAFAQIEDFYGVIDQITGEVIIPIEFDRLHPISENKVFVENNGKIGCYNMDGKQIIDLKYDVYEDENYYFKNGIALVSKNGKIGYINKRSKEIIPFIYDFGSDFSSNLAAVRSNDKVLYISKKNKCKLFCD